jgi:hypothetical protein
MSEPRFRIGATNLTGLGAVQLAGSLLPALDRAPGARLDTVYLPDRGELAGWRPATPDARVVPYRRRLPNAVSRTLECTVGGGFFAGAAPLLTLGDVPVRSTARQLVFVQNTHLTAGGSTALRYRVARRLFRANLRFVDAAVVQTEAMRAALLASYPIAPERIHVIGQPPPKWFASAAPHRTGRVRDGQLALFYPAAAYPHKNHALLARLDPAAWTALVEELTVTVGPGEVAPLPGLHAAGRLGPDAMLGRYARADALLFLSTSESYGFPLVEAMVAGLPIIAPDLPYAQTLCGDAAIYFDPAAPKSLLAALATLRDRLAAGWWPDWRAALAALPPSWDEVAAALLTVLFAAADARR